MSNRITLLCRPLRMSPAQKAVLMCVADRADDQGLAWPSIPGICEWTCLSRTAVIEAMKWLEAQHLIVVKKEVGRNNRCSINTEILERLVQELDRETEPDPSATQTGTADTPVRETDPTSAPGVPPPVRQTDHTRPADAPEASISITQASEKHQTTRSPKARASALPANFGISPAVQRWAVEKGHADLDQHLENFVGWAKARGAKYLDWDQALMNAIRGNWAKAPSRAATAQWGGAKRKVVLAHSNTDRRNYEQPIS